jgi:ribonuclease BN (tRNA processing enzyme)
VGSLELTFIGSGNAFAVGGLCWNGFVVNRRFLFEAPPQALMSLNKLGIEANDLDAVLISHHHGDHFLGLPMLLLHWQHRGRTKPLRIIGPPETRLRAQAIMEHVYPGHGDGGYELEWVEVAAGAPTRVGGLEIEPVEVQHDTKLTLNLGYGCKLDGRTFAYTGDTAHCDAVTDLARVAEVLVAECASIDRPSDMHMSLAHDIPHVRAAMKDEAKLILTHVLPGMKPEGLGNTVVAEDYGTYTYR